MQFIGYATSGLDDNYTPIATGRSREECFNTTVTRALEMMLLHGSIEVQQRDDIDPATFAELEKTIADFCAENGLRPNPSPDNAVRFVEDGPVIPIKLNPQSEDQS